VLQKLMGVWKEGGELSLSGHPEQPVDGPVLGEAILFGHPLQLAFVEHVHGFITLDGPLGRGNPPNPNPGFTRRFTKR
jgi:hypothetical protein